MNRQVALFLLPILALLLIGGAYSFKWWKARTATVSPTPIPLSEGLKLGEDAESLVNDFGLSEKTNTQLKVEGVEGTAVVSLSEDGKAFTVIASLSEIDRGGYQVWMEKDGKTTLLGTMREGKGGYIFDYTSAEKLSFPFVVLVSKEAKMDTQMETVVARGVIENK